MKGLIVTADDFGAAVAVNEAVERAHRDGILTAASLMVSAPAAADAVARAKANPSLRVGLHLVLTDGRPTLPPRSIPDLVQGNGQFRNDMAWAGAAIFFSPGAKRQLEEEMAAQFEAFASTGLKLDHVNAHKHYHLHPTIAGMIIKVGTRFGMRAVRVPGEPRRLLARIDASSAPIDFTAPFSALLRARLRHRGLIVPDRVFGLSWSGAMTQPRLLGLIAHLPEGLNEIYLHPANADAYPGSAGGYHYREELEALLDTRVAAAARTPAIRLGGFADFPARR